MPPGGDRELQLPIMKGVRIPEVLPINKEFGMPRRYVEIQVCRVVRQTYWRVLYVPHRDDVDVMIDVLLDYHWTLRTVHV
jgi:hypothetical protein